MSMTTTETPFMSPPVPVSENGTVAPVETDEAANQYMRDLARQRAEQAQILDRYDVEIKRLKAERDDLAAAPGRKIDMLTGALTLFHEKKLEEAKAAGLPEKKWPKSIKLATGTLKSTAGSLSMTGVPKEDDEENYVPFFQWVKKHIPSAITEVPASTRVNLPSLLSGLHEIDEETGDLIFTPAEHDPETGEVTTPAVLVPLAKQTRGDRTFKQAT